MQEPLMERSGYSSQLVYAWFPVLVLVYLLRVLRRVYYHPLARFPGPKIAAATNLYCRYYDLILDGSFVKELPGLHKTYGCPFVCMALMIRLLSHS